MLDGVHPTASGALYRLVMFPFKLEREVPLPQLGKIQK